MKVKDQHAIEAKEAPSPDALKHIPAELYKCTTAEADTTPIVNRSPFRHRADVQDAMNTKEQGICQHWVTPITPLQRQYEGSCKNQCLKHKGIDQPEQTNKHTMSSSWWVQRRTRSSNIFRDIRATPSERLKPCWCFVHSKRHRLPIRM